MAELDRASVGTTSCCLAKLADRAHSWIYEHTQEQNGSSQEHNGDSSAGRTAFLKVSEANSLHHRPQPFTPCRQTQSGGAVHTLGLPARCRWCKRCFVEVLLLRPVRNVAVLTVFLSAAIAALLLRERNYPYEIDPYLG